MAQKKALFVMQLLACRQLYSPTSKGLKCAAKGQGGISETQFDQTTRQAIVQKVTEVAT